MPNIYTKDYYKKNKERLFASQKKYREKNREKYNAYQRSFYHKKKLNKKYEIHIKK